MYVKEVIRLNTEHAYKVKIQQKENESLKADHAAEIGAIRSEFVALWQAFCLQKAEE
jgi:hypothetical protein